MIFKGLKNKQDNRYSVCIEDLAQTIKEIKENHKDAINEYKGKHYLTLFENEGQYGKFFTLGENKKPEQPKEEQSGEPLPF